MTEADLVDPDSHIFRNHQHRVENELTSYFSATENEQFAKFNRAEVLEFVTLQKLRQRYSRQSDSDVYAKVNLVYEVPEVSTDDFNTELVDDIIQELSPETDQSSKKSLAVLFKFFQIPL